VGGILSDNSFHPELPAWFADKLSSIASATDTPLAELISDLCSDEPCKRANAWIAIGRVEGFENLDHDPLTFSRRSEVMLRYADTVEQKRVVEQRVEHEETVSHPGKFEGCSAWVPYFWDKGLNGMADDDEYDVFTFEVTDEDEMIFPELADVSRVYLSEDGNGFVNELDGPGEAPDDEDSDDEDSDDDDEPSEPDDEDWVTEDHITFRAHGTRGVLVVPEGAEWRDVLKARMVADNFFPNVWFVSDHGNAHILSLSDDDA
jgi:hypothetical protein